MRSDPLGPSLHLRWGELRKHSWQIVICYPYFPFPLAILVTLEKLVYLIGNLMWPALNITCTIEWGLEYIA
jgi:hypothetical protein